MNKENYTSAFEGKNKHNGPSKRKPLGHIPLENQVTISSKTVTSTVIVKKIKTTTEKVENVATETKVNYTVKRQKIVEREDENGKVRSEQTVFEIGADRYVKPEKREKSEKLNKQRKSETQDLRRVRDEDVFHNHFYNEEYFEDNYEYMLAMEHKFVYPQGIVLERVDEKYRRIVVNWLNNVHHSFSLAEETFFKAIRIFDHVLVVSKIPPSSYTLMGLTSMWIANKYYDNHAFNIKPVNLAVISGTHFTVTDIAREEKQILQSLNFELHFPETLTFLFYYLKQQKLEKNSKIRLSATFLLEIFTLLLDFSSLTSSTLSAVALHQVLLKYNLGDSSFLKFVNEDLINKDEFIAKSDHLGECAEYVLKCKTTCSEILEKYSSEEKCRVAMNFVSY